MPRRRRSRERAHLAGYFARRTQDVNDTDEEPSAPPPVPVPASTYLAPLYPATLSSVLLEGDYTVIQGKLVIVKDAGTLGVLVNDTQTTIDFGQTMTPDDFIVFSFNGLLEWMKVGTLVTGTEYNVTRNLDGSGANEWAIGTPYTVIGKENTGRLEFKLDTNPATSTLTPRIELIKQGALYNSGTKVVIIGDLEGEFGKDTAAEYYGFAAGDYAGGNYIRYETASGFKLSAGGGTLTLDGQGAAIAISDAFEDVRAYRFTYGGATSSLLRARAEPAALLHFVELKVNPLSGMESRFEIEALGYDTDGASITINARTETNPGGAVVGNPYIHLQSDPSDWATESKISLVCGGVQIIQDQYTTGSPYVLKIDTITSPHTTLDAGVEASDVIFDLSHSVQYNTGAMTSLRAMKIFAPTYRFVAPSTVTTAATLYIDDAPFAGTNATITSRHSIWCAAGVARFDGGIKAGGAAFPSSPVNGDLFFRTDLDELFEYNGSSWWSLEKEFAFSTSFANMGGAATGITGAGLTYIAGGALPSNYEMFITRVVFTSRVLTPNTATDNWTLNVISGTTLAGTTTIASRNTNGNGTNFARNELAAGAVNDPDTTHTFMTFSATRNNNPGALVAMVNVRYRYIAT